jgi:AraC-like DNA-binding protein
LEDVVLDRPLALGAERRMPGASSDLLVRARSLLADPANGYPGLEGVAAGLGVGSRTLRRHLRRHGTTFQALRDAARERRAIALLEHTELRIDEIALQLGYRDASGLIRAFQCWTGVTPSAFRGRIRAAVIARDQPALAQR